MTNDKKNILLIEDDDVIIKLLVKRIEKAGYNVEVARNGKGGIQKIKERMPDLLLLDMIMPILDGFGVLEYLKKENILPGLPVIIVSNSGQPVEIERILKMGVRDYLVKLNFSPNELIEKIRNVFKN